MIYDENPIDISEMITIEDIATSDIEYREEVIELTERAKRYLSDMSWCVKLNQGWLAYALGYIIGVYLIHFQPNRDDIPEYVWVVIGDIPPAYLDVEYCPDWLAAVDGYIVEMQEWVDRVLNRLPIDHTVISVNVPPEEEWAESLGSRLKFIQKHIIEDGLDDHEIYDLHSDLPDDPMN